MTDQQEAPPAITSHADAAMIVDAIRTAQDRAFRIRENAEAIIADAKKAIDQAEADARAVELYHADALQGWLRATLTGAKRSVRLITGTVGLRAVPGGLRLVDADAALTWARQNKPDLVVVKESVTITALREYAEASGELPDGVEMTLGEDRLYVK